jgi:hypothetical protein
MRNHWQVKAVTASNGASSQNRRFIVFNICHRFLKAEPLSGRRTVRHSAVQKSVSQGHLMSRTTTALLLLVAAVVALLAIGAAAAAAEDADAANYVAVAACAPGEARAQR